MDTEAEYEVSFTDDYLQYQEWSIGTDETAKHFKQRVEDNPDGLEMCKKWSGKSIKLSEIPEFIKEVGPCVISEGNIEVYNGYRE